MKKYKMIPRVMEAINVKNDLELFTSIIIMKRDFVRLIFTTCYLGSSSDNKKTKYHLLYILERFKKNHSDKTDPMSDLLEKYKISFGDIETIILEEYQNAVDDFESLKKSI
jgi:hypothetical protein